MYGVVSLLLLCSALLLMQAAIAGARMQPQPRWITDNMQAYAVVPYIVTALVSGIGGLATWLVNGMWRGQSAVAWGVMVLTAVVYTLLRRRLKAWAAARIASQPALAVVEGMEKPQDPGRPPQRPRLKKAA
jgi:hypothetical protein